MSSILDGIKNFKLSSSDITELYVQLADPETVKKNKESASSSSSKVNLPAVVNSSNLVNSLNTVSETKNSVKSPVLTREREDFAEKFTAQREKYEAKSNSKRLNTAIDYHSELDSVKNNVNLAKNEVKGIKDLLNSLASADLDDELIDAIKNGLNNAIKTLSDVKNNTEIKGKDVFSSNLVIATPTSSDQPNIATVTEPSLVPKPDSVKNLSSTGSINSISVGYFDSFGSKIFANDKYVVVAAKDAASLNTTDLNEDKKYNDGAVDVFDAQTGAALGRYRLGESGNGFSTGINDSKYFTGLTSIGGGKTTYKNDFRNLNFGADFDVEGDYMVVGAPSLDCKYKNGTAFLYDIKNETLIKELKMPTGSEDANFGKSVEIIDNKIYVSSFSDKSKIYTFDMAGNSTGVIESPNGTNFLGSDITASGDNLIISASKERVDGKNGAGEVYVYDKNTNALKYTLKSPVVGNENGFGTKVEAYGNLLAVSEPMRFGDKGDNRSGNVHLFNSDTGEFIKSLKTSSSLSAGDRFGSALAISDKFIAVAAEGDDTEGKDTGAVYVFDKETGVELAKITKSGSKEFGSSLAIKDNELLIGSTVDNVSSGGTNYQEAGTVYKYDISSLEANADAYKTALAAKQAEGVVATGLDVNYLKSIDVDALATAAPADLNNTLGVINKNLDQILSSVSSIDSAVSQSLSSLQSTITTLSPTTPDLGPNTGNITVNPSNIPVQANADPNVVTNVLPSVNTVPN